MVVTPAQINRAAAIIQTAYRGYQANRSTISSVRRRLWARSPGGRLRRGASPRYSRTPRTRRGRRARQTRTRNFSKKNVGFPIGGSASKLFTVSYLTPIDRNSRVLYSQNLTEIPFANLETESRTHRERNIINVTGFSCHLEFVNKSAEPLQLHVSLLSPRTAQNTIPTADFFRGNDQRGVNFQNSLGGIEFATYPINTDLYTILYHKRYMLRQKIDGTVVDRAGMNFKQIKFYKKLNRQLRFDNSTVDIPTDGTVWLVYWFDYVQCPTGTAPTAAAASYTSVCKTYFREVCDC